MEAYVRAVEIEPRHEDAWSNINVMLEGADNNDDLLPILTEVVRLDPDNPHAWHNYGLSLMLAGKKTEAADALEKLPGIWRRCLVGSGLACPGSVFSRKAGPRRGAP